MPFDGTVYQQFDTLAKLDQVTALLAEERHWCKGRLVTEDGRRCLLGAIKAASAQTQLKGPILLAIRQVTQRPFKTIPRFNDDAATTHETVLCVLRQARQNIAVGVAAPDGLGPRRMGMLAARCRALLGAGA